MKDIKELKLNHLFGNNKWNIPVEIEISEHQIFKNFLVADTVKVFDGSTNFDAVTGEKRNGLDPLFKNNNAVVAEIDCTKYLLQNLGFATYLDRCDLLLEFPSGEKVYCNSRMVGLIEQKEVSDESK